MTITLGIIAIIMVYGFIAGASYSAIMRGMKTRHGCLDRRSCSDDHEFTAGALSVFWPVGGPAMLGRTFAATSKNEREIAKAKHQAELARIKRIEEEETTRRLNAISQ